MTANNERVLPPSIVFSFLPRSGWNQRIQGARLEFICFATIFGDIKSDVPVLAIEAINDPGQGYALPWRCMDALSTDALIAVPGKGSDL